MKKIYTYILMIACAAMFAGCQKDFDGIFNAEIEGYNGGDGKVYIDQNYACWNDGDKVMINGEECEVKTNVMVGDVKTAQIVSQRSTDATKYTAIYPAKFANGSGQTYTLPQMQKYQTVTMGSSTVQKIDAPMVAYAEWSEDTPTLVFKNAGALVKVIVKNNYNQGTITLRRIDLVGSQNATLWGTVSYDQAANADPALSTIVNDAENKNIVSLSFYENPVELAADAEATFYIAVPTTATTTLQPKVYYTTAEDEDKAHTVSKNLIRTKSSTNSREIVRNQMYRMDLTSGTSEDGSIKLFGTGSEEDPYLIFTFADFTRMGTTRSLHFKQMNDFVREDYYKNTNCPIISPLCVYDGNNKTITITADNTYKKTIGVFQEVNGTNHTAIVQNLIVNADINITSTANANWAIGGIADHAISNAKFIKCTVNGRIIAEGRERIGGIVGDQSWSLSIDNCTNNAEIKGKKYVGGILGYIANSNSNTNLKICTNNGTLTSQSGIPGGIIGYVTEKLYVIENCNPGTNYAEIGQYGTPNNPYLIANATELINKMNETDGSSKCYKLTNNIILPDDFAGFPEYGNAQSACIFYGNGKTITNPTNNSLFQLISKGATIKDLTVDVNVNVNNTRNRPYGGIVGFIKSTGYNENDIQPTLIQNCHVTGTINIAKCDSIGGLCGSIYHNKRTVTIENCTNNANIASYGLRMGGVIGSCTGAGTTVKRCINQGTITVTNSASSVGGIVGSFGRNATMLNCINKANITHTNGTIYTCGGIAGDVFEGWYNMHVYNCVNHGSITATANKLGGLCGLVIVGEVFNCYSDGTITNNYADGFTGGLIGEKCADVNLKNVYIGGSKPTNGKWIVDYNHHNQEGYATIEHIYSPSNNETENGIENVTQYTNENGTLMVGTETLLNTLNDFAQGSNERWTIINGKPGLAFENQLQPTPSR